MRPASDFIYIQLSNSRVIPVKIRTNVLLLCDKLNIFLKKSKKRLTF